MKKIILSITGLILLTSLQAQSLEEIVKRYTVANKLDKVTSISTIKITGNLSAMGMEMPMTILMKNPDKIKSVTSFNGMDMIQVFDGVKGYTVNPMTGSTTPVEMTDEQIKQTERSIIFQNYMDNYLKKGVLALAGEDVVNSKPAFRLKATVEGGSVIDIFIDKSTYLLVKTSMTTTQQGTPVTVDSFPSDYTETSGLLIPMKITTTAQGMEILLNYTKVEVNIPVDDSTFKVN